MVLMLWICTGCGVFWTERHEHGQLFKVKQIRRDLVRLLETLLNRGEWQWTSPSKLEPLIILKAQKIPIPPQHLLISQLNYEPSPDRQEHEPSYTNVIKQSS